MLSKFKHVPLYIQLKEEIKDKIKSSTWQVDSQIPTEKSLMEEYNVGRATVREALSHLVNEGYLYKRQGVGTFVAGRQSSLGYEPLISLTYFLRARGVSPRNKVVENSIVVPDKALLSSMKWKKSRACFYLKRIRYAETMPLAIENSYFDQEFQRVAAEQDLTSSLAKIILEELKLNVKKVEQVVINRYPTEEEAVILNLDLNSAVMQLERWIYIEDRKEPFYYLHFIIPGSIYNMTMEDL